jgi:hypothetical protein
MSLKTRTILALSAVVALAATISGVAIAILLPNRVVIRNDGQTDLHSVELTLRDSSGCLVLCKSVPMLAPGESVTFRHSANDPRADLRFALAGQVYSEHEAFDLWRGEGWVLAVSANGRVSSSYEGVPAASDPD